MNPNPSMPVVVDLMSGGLTGKIIGAAIEVHKELGPGLLESIYEACLARELAARRIPFERQVAVPIVYKGEMLPDSSPLRIDLLVDDTVIVELKAVEKVHPVHEVTLTTYLRLTGKHVGLIINFNVPVLKNGIVRRVL
jgi:GxxExxY protein